MTPILKRSLAVTIASSLLSTTALAASDSDELLSMSLDELTNIEVTSVSKKAEKASEAAAAIFVVTDEDIKRSGATSIPEALRIVPGLHVARTGTYQWALSSRGFTTQFANMLLVMIDGRSIYSPLFSGVWWDVQDVMLEDIDRIEVIRGPGSTLWGANAVNGIINIITKKAADTQGGLASVMYGNVETPITALRYGAKTKSGDTYYRAYTKYQRGEDQKVYGNGGVGDNIYRKQVGFRADSKINDKTDMTIQGDLYSINEYLNLGLPSFVTPPVTPLRDSVEASGGNILGRWTYKQSDTSEYSVQAYIDTVKRVTFPFDYRTNTYDLDFQHAWDFHPRHELVWGAGYRLVKDYQDDSFFYSINPKNRSDGLFSAFVQDKYAVVPDTFYITLGSKFENNDYTGSEFQPNARMTWLINDRQTLWGSVTRAVRVPNRFSDDGSLRLASVSPPPLPGFVNFQNDRGLESEELVAYELGYRIMPADNVSFDLAAFYNDYDNIVIPQVNPLGTSIGFSPTLGIFANIPAPITNNNKAQSYGFEVAANWEPTSIWHLTSSYSYMELKFDNPFAIFSVDGTSPEQQFSLRSVLELPHEWELSNSVYYVDSLEKIGIPDYWRFDTKLSWRPADNLELGLVGQNLLDSEHPEFSGFLYQNNTEIVRSYYGYLTYKF